MAYFELLSRTVIVVACNAGREATLTHKRTHTHTEHTNCQIDWRNNIGATATATATIAANLTVHVVGAGAGAINIPCRVAVTVTVAAANANGVVPTAACSDNHTLFR